MAKLFPLGETGDMHEIGNEECADCWGDYPKPCECGGLIHASWGDENIDDYWLYTQCDRCGEEE